MKKIISHAVRGLLICMLLCSSLGNVQGSNTTLIQESDPIAETKYDQPLVSATSISVGGDHSCAVTTEGGVKCWGDNGSGQLGDGTEYDSLTPVDVVELTDEVVIAVSAGSGHTCALTSDGAVKCWGYNGSGQLGDETTDNSLTPVDVKYLTGVVSISAGESHTCALTSAGGVKCWGNNYNGRLGDGTTDSKSTPVSVKVSPSEDLLAIAVSAGEYHTCAVTLANKVMCWGYNSDGQLGDGTTTDRLTPVTVKVSLSLDLLAVAVNAGGSHTCAVTSTNGVMCWGYNGDGQLGVDTSPNYYSSTPEEVGGLTSVVDVSTGNYHTCARTSAGGVKCWGNNGYGQLGDGKTTESFTPVPVSGLTSDVKEISAGRYHTCALTAGGGVKCWGGNEYGQLGDETTTKVTTAVDVFGLSSGVSKVSAGFQYTCALTETGGVNCWGDKFYALDDPDGDWTNTNTSTPIDVVELTSGVKAISSGKYHTCAITEADVVMCWGFNRYGQLGDGTTTNRLTPVTVKESPSEDLLAKAISAGEYHTCALTLAGGVKCWGEDDFGQLGNGETTTGPSSIPVTVDGLTSGVKAISAGASYNCAITENNGIKCWGNNQFGQLGYNVTSSCSIYSLCSDTPDFVDGFTDTDDDENAIVISAGFQHTCAITTTGEVWCWGYNEYGQLGRGYTNKTPNETPVTVKELTGSDPSPDLLAVEVSAGERHTCALTAIGGAVKCWGYNNDGRLGDGTTTDRLKAVNVFELTSGMIEVSAGDYHTCAITPVGGVKCWGNNERGQLGWKLLWYPVDVIGFIDNFMIYLPVIVRK